MTAKDLLHSVSLKVILNFFLNNQFYLIDHLKISLYLICEKISLISGLHIFELIIHASFFKFTISSINL